MKYEKITLVIQSLLRDPVEPTQVEKKEEHERNVINRFAKFGFDILDRKKHKSGFTDFEEWLYVGTQFMPNNSVMAHPCGKNRAPDLAVCENNKIILFECKGKMSGNFQFNSSLAHPQIIYILSKHKKTYILRGDKLILTEAREPFLDYVDDVESIPKPDHEVVGVRNRQFYFIKNETEFLTRIEDIAANEIILELSGEKEFPIEWFEHFKIPVNLIDFCK